MRRVRGDNAPQVLEGRLPDGEEEIVFGGVTARKAGVEVGEAVTLSGTSGTHTYRVVGRAVLTGFGSNEGVGEGAFVT